MIGVPEWIRTTDKPALGGRCSIQLSYENIYEDFSTKCHQMQYIARNVI